jgi:16S rRNA (guanine966-N2)-methyltransferase
MDSSALGDGSLTWLEAEGWSLKELRIIAGTLKGRRLDAPSWPGLRPTSDKLRETLFNILGARLAGARVLDACAGTGAVGIEAISRGAAHVTFIDRDSRAIALIEQNLARCAVSGGYAIIRAELDGGASRAPQADFDFIFLDPPYDTDASAIGRAVGPWLAPDGMLIVEYARRAGAPASIDGLQKVREVTSGDSALGFYKAEG